jgi:hypothetical protein
MPPEHLLGRSKNQPLDRTLELVPATLQGGPRPLGIAWVAPKNGAAEAGPATVLIGRSSVALI